MKTTYETEDRQFIVEFHLTPFHPAEPSWHGGAGSPPEGGEVVIDQIEPPVRQGSNLWFDIVQHCYGVADATDS